MSPSAFAVTLTGLALGLLALGTFVWAWRCRHFTQLRAQSHVVLDPRDLPRDLVKAIVSREASERFSHGFAHPPRREVLRDAALGGLLGFILSGLVALALVVIPGHELPRATGVIQLLGPEVGVVIGAALGAVFGRFKRRRLPGRHARAAAKPSAILLAVRPQSNDEAPTLEQILTAGWQGVRFD